MFTAENFWHWATCPTIRARLLIAEEDTMRKISGLKKISKGVYEYNGVEIVQHGRKDWRYEISQGNEGQSESLEQSIVDLESEMYLRSLHCAGVE
jgi:hypothetical protein